MLWQVVRNTLCMNEPTPSFLVIRLSSMGDVLLATPLLRQIRAVYPHARVDVAVDTRFADVVRCNPRVDSVLSYSKSLSDAELAALMSHLRSSLLHSAYTAVVDLQRNRHSRRIRRGVSRSLYRINKARLQKLALVHLKKNLYGVTTPIAERYRAAAHNIGIDDDGLGLELWLPEEQSLAVYPPSVRVQHGARKRIAVAPGAHHATKRWLPSNFAEAASLLAAERGAEVVLLGGQADRDVCADVALSLAPGVPVLDASGSTSVFDTARLLDTCDVLLTNDTGVMHIAAARQVPVVAVFGSTVREFGFAPYRVPNRVVEVALPCRPCTHIGRARCPLKHFRCMTLVAPHAVVNAARELLSSAANTPHTQTGA